jgi:hypothetical protein
MKYRERLKLAATALAREVAQHRRNRAPDPLPLAIYEARLSAVTDARRRWSGWLRTHPFSTPEQRREAKGELGLPRTRRECLRQIEAIHIDVIRRLRAG